MDKAFVERSIVGVLKRAGLDLWQDQIKPGRVAMVLIAAELPSNLEGGARVDVSVSAIGDAISLAGGTLLPTPLRDSNGMVYTVSQGRISVGGPLEGLTGTSQRSRAEERSGIVAGGAVVDGRRLQAAAIY